VPDAHTTRVPGLFLRFIELAYPAAGAHTTRAPELFLSGACAAFVL
jgi:hypothetical protein